MVEAILTVVVILLALVGLTDVINWLSYKLFYEKPAEPENKIKEKTKGEPEFETKNNNKYKL